LDLCRIDAVHDPTPFACLVFAAWASKAATKRKEYRVTKSVLMVCLGNICRSPLAEGALRHHAARIGLDITVDSAGTGDWHIGHPPDARAQDVAQRLGGIDLGGLRARQVKADDFHRFDHIIAMDHSNLRNLRAMAPDNGKAKLSLLLDHLPGHAGQVVPDPYYDGDEAFEHVWTLVDAAAQALVGKLG
jgi:protein-tyrosine phosphatase